MPLMQIKLKCGECGMGFNQVRSVEKQVNNVNKEVNSSSIEVVAVVSPQEAQETKLPQSVKQTQALNMKSIFSRNFCKPSNREK